MLRFDLRAALNAYEARTGLRVTYEELSARTGIAEDTLKSLATRPDYNATLKILTTIAGVLNCDPREFLVWEEGSGES